MDDRVAPFVFFIGFWVNTLKLGAVDKKKVDAPKNDTCESQHPLVFDRTDVGWPPVCVL